MDPETRMGPVVRRYRDLDPSRPGHPFTLRPVHHLISNSRQSLTVNGEVTVIKEK